MKIAFSLTVLLVLVTLARTFEVTESFFSDILQQWNDDSAIDPCTPPCQTDKPLQERIESIKISAYYSFVFSVHNPELQKSLKSDLIGLLEGHSMRSLQKVQILHRLASDRRVKNICEIGFNAGYSSINFLISNPQANIVTFDLFTHPYSSLAINSIYKHFPTRNVLAVAGDSSQSVPRFARQLAPGERCQLLFIDGGHLPHQLDADLEQMYSLADPEFNRVVVDDVEMVGLSDVWKKHVDAGKVKEIELVAGIVSSSCFMDTFVEQGRYFEFQTSDFELCDEEMTNNEKVAIGTYVFPAGPSADRQ